MWNLVRPPWLSAFLSPLESPLQPLVQTVIKASTSGVPLQQTIALTLRGLVKLAEVLPPQLFRVAGTLQEDIPADVKPLGKSVLLQMLISGKQQ